jgi:hypothetical protein
MSFTWIDFFEELADKILNFRNNQKGLIEVLRRTDMFDKGLTDRDSDGNYFPMEEIDPFTFFSLLMKYGFDKRIIVFEFLKTELEIKAQLPEDNDGVPSSLAVSSWLISYKADRQETDISTLWDLFEAALKNNITNELFERALNIKGAGYSKITQGLFRIRPRLYFPIDRQTKPFLKNHSISFACEKTKKYSDYEHCLNKISQVFPESSFYALSHRAWEEKHPPKSPENEKKDAKPSNVESEKSTENILRYWIYAPGPNAKFWDECWAKSIMVYGADELLDLQTYESKNAIEEALKKALRTKGRPTNDALAAWEFSRVVKPGDVIILKKGRKQYIGYGNVTGPYVYDARRATYRNVRTVNWVKKGEWNEAGEPIVLKTLTDITKYPDYVEKLKKLIGIDLRLMPALNTILYGPPGTGKTYRLKNEFFKKFTDEQSTKTKAEFCEEIVKDLAWWQIISIVMIDLKKAKVQDVFEHPLLQAKARISENKTPKNTIWGLLQRHTKNDCPNVNFAKRDNPLFFWKDEKSLWSVDEEMARAETPDFFDVLEIYHSYRPETKTEKRYVFTTFHQSYSYEDFIEGIKPRLSKLEDEIETQDVDYHIENGIFKEIAEKAESHPGKEYAIFIDEINRGNIANIFGELITLIEEDKRIGCNNEIRAVLPYSKKEFGIPKNLYIIGTMNTADRSVEALDTALRRRFSFVCVQPDPETLSEEPFACIGIELDKMLTAINSRIEKLLDSDYCIGHSYFMAIQNRQAPLNELTTIFLNKILPLLQEYFYGDWGKIILVLGKGFIEKKINSVKFLSTEEYEDHEEFEEKPIYNFTDSEIWTLETFKGIYE